MINELEALETLSHPHLLHVYELLYDAERYYIVTELCEHGNLYKFIENRQRCGSKYIKEKYAKQLAY